MITIIEQRLLKKIHSYHEKKSTKMNHLYFGYGANANPTFFSKRVKNFNIIGPAVLKGYQLSFNTPCEYKLKGFAGVSKSSNETVYGTLFSVSGEGLLLLDVLEWVKFGFYNRSQLKVTCGEEVLNSHVYIPTNPRQGLYPSEGYLNLLIKGAIEMKFPDEYLKHLQAHEYRLQFELDHSFNLSNPAVSRWLPPSFYGLHDKLREKLCNLI
jgi:hypothetical protein